MIKRALFEAIVKSLAEYPVISITGPRQSGKTTLCRTTLPNYTYFNLERIDNREMVLSDPIGFLNRYTKNGLILDEAQRAPELFSYIQSYVDDHKSMGKIILTGSQNFLLSNAISQSLAGRVKNFRLLPFSYFELSHLKSFTSISTDKMLFDGLYPPIYDRSVSPSDWYGNYIETYLERDVRTLKNISDLHLFQKFIGLCAGRIGQLLNFSSLASDLGVSSHTVKNWLGVLEANYIIILLQPHHNNLNKRITKQPKLYFLDTGLACALAHINSADTLSRHYLRGSIYENYAICEYLKFRFNQGLSSNLYFWRDHHGNEVDMVIDNGKLNALEIKSGETFHSDMLKGLRYWQKLTNTPKKNTALLFGGNETRYSGEAEILTLSQLNSWFNTL